MNIVSLLNNKFSNNKKSCWHLFPSGVLHLEKSFVAVNTFKIIVDSSFGDNV